MIMAAIGKDVYDADAVAFDPFSPESTWGHNRKPTNRPCVNSCWIPLRRWASWTQASRILREAAQLFFQPGVGERHSSQKAGNATVDKWSGSP